MTVQKIGKFFTVIPHTKEAIQMAYSAGFISFDTMKDKLSTFEEDDALDREAC